MKKVVIYILLSAFLFSTMEVALKFAGNQFDPFQLTFLRFLIGGFFLLPFAVHKARKSKVTLTKGDVFYLLLLGICCICVSMIFFQLGVDHTNASSAAVIFCINPMFTMFFSHFLTEEKMNRKKAAALVIGLVGIIFMINPFQLAPGSTVIGACFSVLAAVFFGLYSAMGRRSIQKLGGLTQTAFSFLLGTAVMFPLLLLLKKPVFSGMTVGQLPILLYAGIMITGFGYLFYFLAMELSDATTASVVFFIKPGLAPVMAVLVLHEKILWSGIVGIGLIFLCSAINLKEQKKKKTEGGSSNGSIEPCQH